MQRGARVLIVEDDMLVARGIAGTLTSLGHEVAGSVTSGEAAIAAAAEVTPDVVLMDVRLEGEMDGTEAAAHLRQQLDVPVVFLTAYSDNETVLRATASGPFGYVVKPYEERDLSIALELALLKHGTERRLREAAALLEAANLELVHQKGFLDALFETLPCGVLAFDETLGLRTANSFVRELLGHEVSELARRRDVASGQGGETSTTGEQPSGHPGTTSTALLQRYVREAFAGHQAHRDLLELSVTRATRPTPVRLRISTVTTEHEGERLCVVLLEDVTELGAMRTMLRAQGVFGNLVGGTEAMLAVYDAIHEVASSDAPVIIQGESGTGKELVALAIHERSRRAAAPFVAVNCGALPENLLESELFGHVKGAFTGAVRDKKGRFELADGGTLFLDEIGEISPLIQVKLLRALQDGSFDPVGSERTLRADVRLVAATNRNLRKEISAGRFRADLYYRLAVVPINLPPLREHKADIPLLVDHILERLATQQGGSKAMVHPEAMAVLAEHAWPGNVRELDNVLQYALVRARGGEIRVEHLPTWAQDPGPPDPKWLDTRLHRLSFEEVVEALTATRGSRVLAAKRLGVSRATLYRYLSSLQDSGE